MKTALLSLIPLFLGHVGALSTGLPDTINSTTLPRAEETCGDPSVATTFYKGFHAVSKVHAFNTQAKFVNSMALGDVWQSTIPSFRGWTSPGQPGTVPLFFSQSATTGDVTYTLAESPNLSVIGYVYPTQVCNSVPLYAAAQVSLADHWHTTILIEHEELVGISGWVDQGVLAYVLPIDDSTDW